MKLIKKIILIVLFLVTAVVANNNTKHILVLHSYNKAMTWETNIDKAVVDILQPSKNGYILHTEYMDTKRVFTKKYLEQLKQLYFIKYKDVKFDIILSSDNNAFNFLRKNRDKLFGNIPTVFCGVNFFKDSDLAGLSNYTGVAENFNAKNTVKTALKLLPKTKKIYIINDYLTTGRAWEKTIKEQLKEYENIEITYNENLSMKQLQQKVHTLDKDSIVLLGVYFKDKNCKYFTYEKVGTLISSSSDVPVFCLLKFNIKGDVIGGDVIGGYYQGKAMAKIAKKILSGTKISLIPVMKDGATKGIYNYKGLNKYNIKFDNVLKNEIIINKPSSFYEKYKVSILIGLFLTLIIILLFILNYKRKSIQKELMLTKQNLEKMIEKRTKELKEKTTYLNRFYNNNGIGILLVDKNRVVKDINTKLAKMWGYTREEMIGKNAQFFHISEKSYKKFGQIAFKQAKQGKPANIAYQFKRKDGSLFWAKFSGEHINESDVLWIITDINALKEKEQALIVLKEKAEEATKLKSIFLANMSHEIRTPMNGITGMTYLALQTTLNEKQKHYLTRIDSSAKNLLNIINDILDFSKIEAGKLTIEKEDFSIKELFANIKSIIKIKTDKKDLDFHIKHNCSLNNICFGDPLRITQILINLLGNAVKFTQAGKIELDVQRQNDNKVRFIVSDTGIGLSKEHIDKLFQSFMQADGSTTRKYGGTGLGLSISKQLVELMNGKIWVESKVDVGSRFIFEIELPKGDIDKIIKKEDINLDQISTLQGSNILLVEDNLTNQEIIKGLLENSKINIDIANNGEEAVDLYKINESKYELILMDMQMPIMDGIEATKIIRKLNQDIPIIALTANAMKEDKIATKNAGMNDHLSKPIEIDKLFSILLKNISKKVEILNQTSEQKEDIELPNFINIDTKIGLSHMANNKKLYLKILNDFYTNHKDLRLEGLDDKELERVVHTIKGLSANTGAVALNRIAMELEDTLDRDLLPKFYKELDIVLEELKDLDFNRDRNFNIELLALEDEKKVELFSKLKDALISRRSKQYKPIIQEIEKYKLDTKYEKLFNQIKDFVKEYKIEKAIKFIENKNDN